ncbi:MAG: hypothetical protein BGP07_03235 [Rhizobiales bacterium 63-22]|nr:MAG: hypothetical protein BGP07_03235 [Rhizobiales bacterium 63-22]
MTSEAAELRSIRTKFQALGGAQWLLSSDAGGMFVEVKTGGGELNEVARFHPGAMPEEIDFFASAPAMVGFLLHLVDRAIASARKDRQPQGQGRAKDFAAEAAMKCDDAAFKVYLEARHGLERPLTADRVAHKLRALLGVSSRKELNNNAIAAERWRSLRADFDGWRRAGR